MDTYVKDFLTQCRDWQAKIKRDLSSLHNSSIGALTDFPHLLFTINRFKLSCRIVKYKQLDILLEALEQLFTSHELIDHKGKPSEETITLITELLSVIDAVYPPKVSRQLF